MPQSQVSRLRPVDEWACPKCLSGTMEQARLGAGSAALSPNIFQCSNCDHVEVVSKAEEKHYGDSPGEPGPAEEAPRGSAGRHHLVMKLLAEEEAKDSAPRTARK